MNNSNLPIYIDDVNISQQSYDKNNHAEIENIDLPILLEPQETKYINFDVVITIPEHIKEYIIEKFPDVDNLNVADVCEYLIFEKETDLLGDKINLDSKYLEDNIYNIYFFTTRNGVFTIEINEGVYFGDLHYLKDKYGLDITLDGYDVIDTEKNKVIRKKGKIVLP